MNRKDLKKLEGRIEEAFEARLRTVAVMMAAAFRDDEFFAELPERGNTAKGEMKALAD